MWCQVVVPTLNSARWIRPIVAAYREAQVDAIYLVDAHSSDGTLEIIAAAGGHARSVNLAAPRVEALSPEIRHLVRPGWVFRVDDDEFPSADTFARLRGAEPDTALDSIAVQRRWVRQSAGGRLQRADCRLWTDNTGEVGGDHQWRIFHTERVKYLTGIHTPGFVPVSWEKAGDEVYLVHFDWVIRSEAERLKKMARYDEQHPNSGSGNWMYYLHERISPEDVRWVDLGSREFDQLAENLLPKVLPRMLACSEIR
jgi:hypothetical protein